MEDLTDLRKRYLELSKLFLYEVQKGKTLKELVDLQSEIDETLVAIDRLEKELNISQSNPDQIT